MFGAFVFSTNRTIKMIGLGMATAVFLDAALVRTVLVPAIMHILGDRNRQLLDWLNRRLPRLDVEGEVIDPSRAAEVPVPA